MLCPSCWYAAATKMSCDCACAIYLHDLGISPIIMIFQLLSQNGTVLFNVRSAFIIYLLHLVDSVYILRPDPQLCDDGPSSLLSSERCQVLKWLTYTSVGPITRMIPVCIHQYVVKGLSRSILFYLL